MNFDTFTEKWLGNKVDYNHNYQYLDIDLVRQYLYECHQLATSDVPSALSYWTSPQPEILSKFFKTSRSDIKKGDVLVLNSAASGIDESVAVATGRDTDMLIEVLEQNGANASGTGEDEDAISLRFINRNRVIGVLRPIDQRIAISEPLPTYTVEMIDPKRVVVTKATYKYNLELQTLAEIESTPVEAVEANTVLTVEAIAAHGSGQSYYLEDSSQPLGYLVDECNNYTAPVNTPVASLPLAPVVASSTEQYRVVKAIAGYPTSGSAALRVNANGMVEKGDYYVFNRFNDMINVGKTLGRPGYWINPHDNVSKPLPAFQPEVKEEPEVPVSHNSWKATYSPVALDRRPIRYVAAKLLAVQDLDGRRADGRLDQYAEIFIYGTFLKDGVLYARPKLQSDKLFENWYGIPMNDPETNEPNLVPYDDVYDSSTDTATRQATHTLNSHDYMVLVAAEVEKLYDKTRKVFDIFKPKKIK